MRKSIAFVLIMCILLCANINCIYAEETTDIMFSENLKINRIINDYNKIATYPITKDMLTESSRTNRIYASINGVKVEIGGYYPEKYSTDKGVWLDFNLEAKTDEGLDTIFIDFIRVLEKDITLEQATDYWKNMVKASKNEKFWDRDYITESGMELSFGTQDVLLSRWNDFNNQVYGYRYIIKVKYPNYIFNEGEITE